MRTAAVFGYSLRRAKNVYVRFGSLVDIELVDIEIVVSRMSALPPKVDMFTIKTNVC